MDKLNILANFTDEELKNELKKRSKENKQKRIKENIRIEYIFIPIKVIDILNKNNILGKVKDRYNNEILCVFKRECIKLPLYNYPKIEDIIYIKHRVTKNSKYPNFNFTISKNYVIINEKEKERIEKEMKEKLNKTSPVEK